MTILPLCMALMASTPTAVPTLEEIELHVREAYSRYHSFSLRYDFRLLRSDPHPHDRIVNPNVKDEDYIATKDESVILDSFGDAIIWEVQSVTATKGGEVRRTHNKIRWTPQRRTSVRFGTKTVLIDEAKPEYLPSQTPIHATALKLDFTEDLSLPDLFDAPEFLNVVGVESIDGHDTVLLVYEPTDAVKTSLLPNRRMAFWLAPDQNWLPRRVARYKHERGDPTAQYDTTEFLQAEDLATGGSLPFPRKVVQTAKYMDFEWTVNSAEINLPRRRFPDEAAVIPAGFVVENRFEPTPTRAVSGGTSGVQKRIGDSVKRARDILEAAGDPGGRASEQFPIWTWVIGLTGACLVALAIWVAVNRRRAR